MMPRVALDCASRGIAGLEFGIGVPGTCGASVYGNAGAFGTEMVDVLIECTALDADGVSRDASTSPNAASGTATRVSSTTCTITSSCSARLRVRPDAPALVRERTDAIQAERESVAAVWDSEPRECLQEPARRQGRPARRGGRAEGAPRRWRADLPEARQLHRQRRPRDRGRRACPCRGRARRCAAAAFDVDLEREIIVLGARDGGRTCLSAAEGRRLLREPLGGARGIGDHRAAGDGGDAVRPHDPGARLHREVGSLVHRRPPARSSSATRTSTG